MNKYGVSPVIGIILLTAVTVALVSLAAFFVFDVGQSTSDGVGTATVTAEYESESKIDVQLLKQGSADRVIVKSALGTEYRLSNVGESIMLLNQDSNQTPIVLAERDGERSVIREVPPRSFTADIVVANGSQGDYSNIQNALNSANDGDIVVLKRNIYYENIDIAQSNITLVGETGTVIADNSTSDSSVVNIQDSGVRIANIGINASSSQGGTPADYTIETSSPVSVVNGELQNGGTNGDVSTITSSSLISQSRINGNIRATFSEPSATAPSPSEYQSLINSMNGSGTVDDPYEVTNDTQLQAINDSNYWDAHYELVNNIDMSKTEQWNNGRGFSSIGAGFRNGFNGSLDGNGYTIKGLYIDRTSGYNGVVGSMALIGSMEKSGSVSNLTLTRATVKAQAVGGTVVAYSTGGTVSNVDVHTNVLVTNGADRAGGAVGSSIRGNITDVHVYNNVTVKSSGRRTGGITGYNYDGLVANSSVHTDVVVTSSEESTGGLVGESRLGSIVRDSQVHSDVVVRGAGFTGGLVGRANHTTAYSSSGDTLVVDSSVHSGVSVNGSNGQVGGLIGRINAGPNGDAQTIVRRSQVTDSVQIETGGNFAGGLVGYNYNGDISRVTVSDTISIQSQNKQAAGLVARNRDGTISNSSVHTDVSITNQYASGAVSTNTGVVSDVFAVTTELNGTDIAGLSVGGNGNFSDSYYASDESGVNNGIGTELTRDEITGSTADTNMPGLDFRDTWNTTSSFAVLQE